MNVNELYVAFSDNVNAFMEYYVFHSRDILNFVHSIFDSMFTFFMLVAFMFTLFYVVMIVYSFVVKPKKERKFQASKAPHVTIQIPTYNELAAINCAKRCLSFDYPKDKFTIIIGDDSNQKSISKQIDAFAAKHKNVLVTRRGKNVGFKPGNLVHMNKYTKTKYAVIFDSDFLPESDFLKRIMTPFIYNPDLAGVQARWNVVNHKQNWVTVLGSSIVRVFHHIVLPFTYQFGKSANFCGSAEAVNMELLKKYGGWKVGALTEDIEYSYRVYRNNSKVEYLPRLTCDCEVPYTVADLCKQQMRWAHGNISAYKEHLLKVLFGKNILPGLKCNALMLMYGYVLTVLIFVLMFTGVISFFTHPPGPINIGQFIFDLVVNVLLSCGLLFAGFVSYFFGDFEFRDFYVFTLMSFSVGFLVMYYVNVGIVQAIRDKPMKWFILKKNGNAVK